MKSDFDRLMEVLTPIGASLRAIEGKLDAGVPIRVSLDPAAAAEFHSKLDTIIQQGVVMAGEVQRLTAAVTVIKGKADSLIALVEGLAGLVRQIPTTDPVTAAALEALAVSLEGESGLIQAAIDANPLPTDPPPVAPPDAIALPDAVVGEPYVASVDVPDAAAVSCIIQAGSLPEGLSLVLEEVSGTPTTPGDYTVVLWHIDEQSFHVGAATTYTIKVI